MILNVKIISVLLCTFLVGGCAAQHVIIDRAVIRNETQTTITEVKVVHEPTRNFGGVHSILPQSSLDLGFSRQPMLGKRAIVTWTSQNGLNNRVELELPYEQVRITKGLTMNLVYTIHPTGHVTVKLTE